VLAAGVFEQNIFAIEGELRRLKPARNGATNLQRLLGRNFAVLCLIYWRTRRLLWWQGTRRGRNCLWISRLRHGDAVDNELVLSSPSVAAVPKPTGCGTRPVVLPARPIKKFVACVFVEGIVGRNAWPLPPNADWAAKNRDLSRMWDPTSFDYIAT